jgi:predicted amidophosphoribosyltransferase
MSSVTKRGRVQTEAMEPLLSGGYSQRQYEGYSWRCDGCGLVWEKRNQAADCERRGHKPAYQAGPYGRCWIENGQLRGNPVFYPRRAIRRERVEAESREEVTA